jgi:hypothetical protein
VDSVTILDAQRSQFNLTGTGVGGDLYLNLPEAATSDLAGNTSSLASFKRAVSGQITLDLGRNVQFEDWDGSLVTVTLAGQGSGYLTLNPQGGTAGAPIGDIVLTNTTQATILAIRTMGGTAPGTSFTRLLIDNAASAGTDALGLLLASGMDLAAGGVIQADGTIHHMELGNIGSGAAIQLSRGSIEKFTAGSIGSLVAISAPDDLQTLEVQSVGAGATISAGNSIRSITVNGPVSAGTTVTAGSGGINTVTISGNANMTVLTSGSVGTFAVSGTSSVQSTASVRMDVASLGALIATYASADSLAVRASGGIGEVRVDNMRNSVLSAGTIGKVTVVRNLSDSMILAGYDIGSDLAFGTADDGAFSSGSGNIGVIKVGGSMSRTSVAANIRPGADLMFGTADDALLSLILQGSIGTLIVSGSLSGSDNPSESFGILAHQTIGNVWAAGSKLTLPYVLGNIVVQQSWR